MTTDGKAPSAPEMAADIVARSQRLLKEMEQLHERLLADQEGSISARKGLRGLMDSLRYDATAAETYLASLTDPSIKFKAGKGDSQSPESRFRTSNIHAIEAHWNILKRCRHLVSVDHKFHKFPKPPKHQRQETAAARPSTKVDPSLTFLHVHAVVDGGAQWIRIITKAEKRLLIEMAEGGWDWGLDEDSSSEDNEQDGDDVLYEEIKTLRQGKELADLARAHWHEYRHPRIRIILTRITEGQNEEIDKFIGKLRRVGGNDVTVDVHCAGSECQPPIEVDTAVSNLLPRDSDLGDTVLVDTSVMIALVSDASHAKLETIAWMQKDVKMHIEDESKGNNFLPFLAVPRLRGKRLVCVEQAMDHFLAVTTKMGTETERERARLLFEGGPADLQKLSIHPVPEDLMLPLHVLPHEETDLAASALVCDGVLPAVAIEVERYLNRNVISTKATHLYGWVTGLTVVTSNRALPRKVMQMIEQSLTEDYENGPRIYALPYTRSLVTSGPSPKQSERLRRKGIWPLRQPKQS